MLNGYYSGSDRRLKRDIVPLKGKARAQIRKLRPSRFKATQVTADADKPNLEFSSSGFIAQELAEVIPEATMEPSPATGGMWSMTINPVVAVTVAAVQEQDEELDFLRAEVDAIHQDTTPAMLAALKRLEDRIVALERRKP